MTIILAVLSVMVSIISPILGLILVLPSIGKTEFNTSSRIKTFYLIWVLSSSVLLATKTIDLMTFIIISLNVGLLSYILIKMLEKEMSPDIIMISTLGISGSTGIVKYLFFRKSIENGINISLESTKSMISSAYSPGTEEFQVLSDTLNFSKELYLKYNYSFAVFTMIITAWIAITILNKKERLNYNLSLYSNINLLVIPVILGLALVINKSTQTLGLNILISCVALYFIQGLAVIWFYFGKMIADSKMLIIISIISLLINPYLILMIAFAGFADNWADLRKLNKMEETHENNTH